MKQQLESLLQRLTLQKEQARIARKKAYESQNGGDAQKADAVYDTLFQVIKELEYIINSPS